MQAPGCLKKQENCSDICSIKITTAKAAGLFQEAAVECKFVSEASEVMADVPYNMKIFNRVALRIFSRLYEAFPMPIEIIPRSMSAEILAADASTDESLNSISIADNTLRWLESEGFLRHSSSSFESGIFYQVQLTLKGLTVLNSVPFTSTQVDVPESMMTKIRKVLSVGNDEAEDDPAGFVMEELLAVAQNKERR
ncbi:MAG TPA: hypothetical protein PLV50_08385 [Smithella sp.]|nr:hypothetical protein [Smithella sp.]MDM7987204.1 hypothetical protein [Smithella sp.]HNY49801.1 hypothetical protein [Smithella sp.]HOG90541.1 hypothetical protein [Smithella sp.]HOU50746.1 hypothetical protein [Smithella sp.]